MLRKYFFILVLVNKAAIFREKYVYFLNLSNNVTHLLIYIFDFGFQVVFIVRKHYWYFVKYIFFNVTFSPPQHLK